MPTLITGSFAYDTIMVFQDKFKNHILPEQTHMLNVAFYVPEMRREFGGCCGNIAYNLKLLGGAPLPMGTVGKDFSPYRKWLEKNHLDLTYIREVPNTFTAQAFVTTDADNNQITAFHPGAMAHAHQNAVTDATAATDIDLGIVAPDGRDAMIQHAAQFSQAGIPFIFDPGQGLPMFTGTELDQFIQQATWVVVNDYESELLQQKTGHNLKQIATQVEALIVTRGAQGADIHHRDASARDVFMHIDSVPISDPKDPTGCGDAFRAGLLYGIANQLDWHTCGQLSALMGGIKIEHHGTQNHQFSKAEFETRYRENFGEKIDLG